MLFLGKLLTNSTINTGHILATRLNFQHDCFDKLFQRALTYYMTIPLCYLRMYVNHDE